MKRITPTLCTEQEFRKLIGIPEITTNETNIKSSDALNIRKRKLLELPQKIVSQHNHGSINTDSSSR